MPDLVAIGDAIAARYAPGTIPTPGGTPTLVAMRSSTADPPDKLTALPCVVVFAASGDLNAGNGTRGGVHTYTVQLFYAQGGIGDLARNWRAVGRWLTVMLDQHKAGVMLGGLVDFARAIGWRVGVLNYARAEYIGAEITVQVRTSEAWAATA